MFQLCVTEPVLTITTRLTAAPLSTCSWKVLPMSSTVGAVVIVGRGASTPPALKR